MFRLFILFFFFLLPFHAHAYKPMIERANLALADIYMDTASVCLGADKKGVEKVKRECSRLAEMGDPTAQYFMAVYSEPPYAQGKQDVDQVITWYQQAAEGGIAYAWFILGNVYHQGRATARGKVVIEADTEKAKGYYRKAGEGGFEPAYSSLGDMYYRNVFNLDKVDYDQAYKWYQKAAESGDPIALTQLAQMYQYGEGVKKDRQKTRRYLLEAAQYGLPEAQYRAGKFLWDPESKDKEAKIEAYKWYMLASLEEHEQATWAFKQMKSHLSQEELNEALQRVDSWRPKKNKAYTDLTEVIKQKLRRKLLALKEIQKIRQRVN